MTPPDTGWIPVSLPDTWQHRWPRRDTVWYRLTWQPTCPLNQPLALTVSGLTMAGAVWLNDTLLWRDARLEEPFSRSWNMPRYWVLPEAALQQGNNTLWVRVTGMKHDLLGIGTVRLGPPEQLWPLHREDIWLKRNLFVLSFSASLALGCLFLALWLVRRKERAFGWYALASLSWALFSAIILATSPWPFSNSTDWNRWSASVFTLYCTAFCFFVWRFSGQHVPRLEQFMSGGLLVALLALWLVPDHYVTQTAMAIFPAFSLAFSVNCLQFQAHAWRHRQRHNILLALCLLFFLVVALHDLLVVLQLIGGGHLLSPITSPVAMLFMFLIVADRFSRNMRRIEAFNSDLQVAISLARNELTQTLQRKHQLETTNIRLTERLRLSHDLHDSLGSSLMRSITLLEQVDTPLSNRRFLSMLKELRDDLRQIIDNTSPSTTSENTTPTEWIAPLRHRFVRLFDEMGLESHWQLPAAWPCQLSSMQLLALTRFLEEALTNAIKHSQCSQLRVTLQPHGNNGLQLQVCDNGQGFDVLATSDISGTGMASMKARITRIGGQLQIHSTPGDTCLSVLLVT